MFFEKESQMHFFLKKLADNNFECNRLLEQLGLLAPSKKKTTLTRIL